MYWIKKIGYYLTINLLNITILSIYDSSINVDICFLNYCSRFLSLEDIAIIFYPYLYIYSRNITFKESLIWNIRYR